MLCCALSVHEFRKLPLRSTSALHMLVVQLQLCCFAAGIMLVLCILCAFRSPGIECFICRPASLSSIPCDQHCHYLSTSLHLLDPVFIVEQVCISNLPPDCNVKHGLHLYVREIVAKYKLLLLTRSVVYMLLCLISVLAVLLVSVVVLCHLVHAWGSLWVSPPAVLPACYIRLQGKVACCPSSIVGCTAHSSVGTLAEAIGWTCCEMCAAISGEHQGGGASHTGSCSWTSTAGLTGPTMHQQFCGVTERAGFAAGLLSVHYWSLGQGNGCVACACKRLHLSQRHHAAVV